jgi:hypothetical protein
VLRAKDSCVIPKKRSGGPQRPPFQKLRTGYRPAAVAAGNIPAIAAQREISEYSVSELFLSPFNFLISRHRLLWKSNHRLRIARYAVETAYRPSSAEGPYTDGTATSFSRK